MADDRIESVLVKGPDGLVVKGVMVVKTTYCGKGEVCFQVNQSLMAAISPEDFEKFMRKLNDVVRDVFKESRNKALMEAVKAAPEVAESQIPS